MKKCPNPAPSLPKVRKRTDHNNPTRLAWVDAAEAKRGGLSVGISVAKDDRIGKKRSIVDVDAFDTLEGGCKLEGKTRLKKIMQELGSISAQVGMP